MKEEAIKEIDDISIMILETKQNSVEYVLTYLSGYDKTLIWKRVYKVDKVNEDGTIDYETMSDELCGWYFGQPEECETVEDVEKFIRAGMKAIFE